jgi:hypothetical protein
MLKSYVIHYYYKKQLHTALTRPCTRKQAKQAFFEELNSLNTFMLVKIVPAN